MKRIAYFILCILISKNYFSQLTGVITVPSASFTSIAAVISALNQQGSSGPLIVNITAGYTETAPLGGYTLTASGTVTAPITFQKSGNAANPLITAYSGGSGTPGSMNQDGIWRLIGSDFVTIDRIDLLDTNSVNPATMEFGYGLFKSDAGNGCWNTTIKNCTITLNRINNATGSGPAMDGSRGIDVVNAVTNDHNSAITVTAVAGSHSFNKFYGNTIRNCNQAVALIGYADSAPYTLSDQGNEIGGGMISDGNTILDFGGGGTTTASAAIRTLAQYNLAVQFNTISNNTGLGINHAATLRGIYLGNAVGASATIRHNTITLSGGGINNQVSVIENISGSGAVSNTISIQNNLIQNCSYTSAVSPAYYGIWNSASPAVLSISNNSFVNNSSHASGGSTYLISNTGAVTNSILIMHNHLGFVFSGSAAYNGTMYFVNNSNGTTATNLTISHNDFSNQYYLYASGGGNLFFIRNTNDSYMLNFSNNTFTQLNLDHSGSQYLIYNSSATQSVLTVCNNSIIGMYQRNASAGPMYGYYANGNSPASSTHLINANNFSNITSTLSGTGVFYGIHSTDGSSSPYPKKIISNNVVSNIAINSSGIFYAYYFDKLGDAAGTNSSEVLGNSVSGISCAGSIYGLYLASAASPSYAVKILENKFLNVFTNGLSSSIYGAYISNAGAGVNFYKNKLSDALATGTAAITHGVYVTSVQSTTLSNNLIGHLNTPNSFANNALNGIYINSGSRVNLFYNTVYLNATSSGGNFNSNALYASTTVSVDLRNSILINTSSGGSGISAVYRRSSTSLSTYSSTSNSNLFYAGAPSVTNVLLQSGSTAYQTLSSAQNALSPREAASVTQSVSFLSLNSTSPNYLHVTPNVFALIESGAQNTSGITDDIDSQTRQGNSGYAGIGTAPDIGADEFELDLTLCNSANAGTISTMSLTTCAGQTIALYSNGYTPGIGLSHQWKVSNVSGGPYTNVTSGNGMTTPEYFSSALSSGTYYFILETTCLNASVTAISQQATVVVNVIPSATATVLSNLICVGQTIQLNASSGGVGTYSWLGPNGFYSTVQNPTLINCTSNASGNYTVVVNVNNCLSPPSTVSVNVSQVTLSLSANPPIICTGNSSTLIALSSANSYAWSNGNTNTHIVVSPTVTSVYSVAVTNTAYCSATKHITLTVISPTISSSGALICGNSGTVNLSVNAFTPSIVNWYSTISSSLSLLSGTTFSINTGSDTTLYAEANQSASGCASIRVPVSVTVSPYPTLSVTANPLIVCPGKTSSLSAIGASTYSWIGIGSGAQRTVNPISLSSYTVVGKNINGCATTTTLLISVYPLPTLTAQQSATSVCPSSILGFTASGAISYTWNTGAIGTITTVTPATNSTYTVYGSNAEGCVSSKTLAVITRSVPLITIYQSADSLCPGEVITFTATGANSYTWLPGGITASTFSAGPFISSVYNAIGRSVNTCTHVAFVMVAVDPCTHLTDNDEFLKHVNVFPNPTHDDIRIDFNRKGHKKILVFNAIGRIIQEKNTMKELETIYLSAYPKGIYFIKVMQDQNFRSFKVIVE
jgi:hypothetical protein